MYTQQPRLRPTRGGKKKKRYEEKRTNDAGDVMWGPDGGGTLAKRVMEGGGAAGMNERTWHVNGKGAARHSRGEGVRARRDGARGRRLQHLGLRHHHVELTCGEKNKTALLCVA